MTVKRGMKLKKIHFNLRTMKDKEKAEELALKYAREYLVSRNDSHKQNILFKESSIIECEKASLEMAKWKDEQSAKKRKELIAKANQAVTESFENGAKFMKECLIEKACAWLENNVRVNGAFYCFVFKKEDIESFKKAMEE